MTNKLEKIFPEGLKVSEDIGTQMIGWSYEDDGEPHICAYWSDLTANEAYSVFVNPDTMQLDAVVLVEYGKKRDRLETGRGLHRSVLGSCKAGAYWF